MISIKSFEKLECSHFKLWDEFIASSRNGVFLFNRHYMDYHADRFTDASLMFYKNDDLIAVLPANAKDKTLNSHGGLTFGGLVVSNKFSAADAIASFEALREHLYQNGFETLVYKPIPHIYHQIPAEEDLYALFKLGAKPVRMDVSTTIKQTHRLALAKGRKHSIAKAKKANVQIEKSTRYDVFWEMLTNNLAQRHEAKPTHSLEEIELLASRFKEIQLYLSYIDGKAVAGVLMYDYGQVAHTQYIALNDHARETGALDFLLEHLISVEYANKPYFNFGISTYNNGQAFNEGLAAQKEMFGGRTTILQHLELEIK
jgi:hypothetical protein